MLLSDVQHQHHSATTTGRRVLLLSLGIMLIVVESRSMGQATADAGPEEPLRTKAVFFSPFSSCISLSLHFFLLTFEGFEGGKREIQNNN